MRCFSKYLAVVIFPSSRVETVPFNNFRRACKYARQIAARTGSGGFGKVFFQGEYNDLMAGKLAPNISELDIIRYRCANVNGRVHKI